MLKVLADKVLAFNRGERDRDGQVVEVKTTVGFCELPDWVAETNYFKTASLDGSVKAFTSVSEGDQALKDQEKAADLRAEIAALEEKRDLLLASGDATDPADTAASEEAVNDAADPVLESTDKKAGKATKK